MFSFNPQGAIGVVLVFFVLAMIGLGSFSIYNKEQLPPIDESPANIDKIICRGAGISKLNLDGPYDVIYVTCGDDSTYTMERRDLQSILRAKQSLKQ